LSEKEKETKKQTMEDNKKETKKQRNKTKINEETKAK
jgi:hypothetical protein